MSDNLTVELAEVPVSNQPCPAGGYRDSFGAWHRGGTAHRLGSEVFWCLTCNEYANDLLNDHGELPSWR